MRTTGLVSAAELGTNLPAGRSLRGGPSTRLSQRGLAQGKPDRAL